MHLIRYRSQSSFPEPSPFENAPADLLIEIGLWLDSRADLLHLGLTVCQISAVHHSY